MTIVPTNPAAPYYTQGSASSAATDAGETFWGEEGFSFKSVLDIVNPLQQLPIVSTIYRALTGDTISPGSRLAGGALLGGPVGFVAALFNTIVESESGKDVGGNLVAMVTGDDSVQLAQNDPSDVTLSPNQRAAYNAYVHASQLA